MFKPLVSVKVKFGKMQAPCAIVFTAPAVFLSKTSTGISIWFYGPDKVFNLWVAAGYTNLKYVIDSRKIYPA